MPEETHEPACETCGSAVDADSGVCRVCATAVQSDAATALTPSSGRASASTDRPEIPGYTILGALGEGGMGAVYLAEENALGRRVAIKVISGRIAASAQSKARFLREARTLATVEHPHVVRVYSFGEVGGRPYLAMEYVEGETLADRIAKGPIPVADALRITRDVVEALEAAWEKKIVHRDIKPSNILIDRRNRVRVADFGLAKGSASGDSDISLTHSGLMVGTPHYISPEQAQGHASDFRADFYSLGIVLFHMLTGERPFEGNTPVAIVARHLHEPIPRRPDLPPEIEDLIRWLTEKDPATRPSSHRDLLETLDRGGRASRPPAPGIMPGAVRAPHTRSLAAAALALLIAALIATVAYKRRQPETPLPFAQPESKFVVAVAPFYGPDPESAREGRLMAGLIERAVIDRLGAQAKVLGIEETKQTVRSHDDARELGAKIHADAVIWGEAFALRDETEIVPHVTLCKEAEKHHVNVSDIRSLSSRADPLQAFSNAEGMPLKLEAQAPNQIEMRKTSASGLGDMAVMLAGIHALEVEKHAEKALALLDQAPQSEQTHRYRVQALLDLNRRDEARAVLEGIVQRDPADAASHALLGDLYLATKDVARATNAYRAAAAAKKPFTTSRGIVFEDRLYVQETYRTARYYSGTEVQTLSLLAIDPATNRVLARHAMPGPIESFRLDGDALVLAYNSEKDDRRSTDELRFRNGQFDRPIYPPPNYLWRMRDVRGGRALAANFVEGLESIRRTGDSGGRIELSKKADPNAPMTLAALESTLRAEMDRDATQPWTPFLLALVLRHQKRDAEAQAAFDALLRREYAVHYYHYSWMMNMLERLRYDAWSAALFRKALAARRRIPQPVTFGTLLERLINASFLRQAALNGDPDHGHRVMQDARVLGGMTPEGEDLVGAMWVREFERRGDAARAERERAIVRTAQAHPFNYLGATAKIDYAINVVAASMVAFVGFVLWLVVRAGVAVWRRPPPAVVRRAKAPGSTQIPRIVRVIAFAIVLAVALIGTAFFAMVKDSWPLLVALLIVALLVYALRRMRISPSAVIGSIATRERRAVGLAAIVTVLALLYAVDRIATGLVIGETPLGLADGMGHARIVRSFEKLLEERGEGRPALVYVTAVANHYAGNFERARTLYDSAPSTPHVIANRNALAARRMPAVHPTPDELLRALGGTRAQRWRDVTEFETLGASFALLMAILVILAVPLLAFVAVPPREDAPRTTPFRHYFMLLLLAMPLLPLWVIARSDSVVPPIGLATRWNLPNIETAYPLPAQFQRLLFVIDYPGAKAFWTFVALCFAAGVALTLKRGQRLDVVRVREEVQQIEAGELPS